VRRQEAGDDEPLDQPERVQRDEERRVDDRATGGEAPETAGTARALGPEPAIEGGARSASGGAAAGTA